MLRTPVRLYEKVMQVYYKNNSRDSIYSNTMILSIEQDNNFWKIVAVCPFFHPSQKCISFKIWWWRRPSKLHIHSKEHIRNKVHIQGSGSYIHCDNSLSAQHQQLHWPFLGGWNSLCWPMLLWLCNRCSLIHNFSTSDVLCKGVRSADNISKDRPTSSASIYFQVWKI